VNQDHELQDLQLQERLQSLRYPEVRQDLWPRVSQRIQQVHDGGSIGRRFLPVAALVVVWRVLQLMFDLPVPLLHPIVPLAAAVWAIRQLAGDPLAIETSAPELRK
jgi:hypothetical protein